MVEVISAEEYARQTGRSLEDVEAMIYEAENDLITRDTMDPSTLKLHIRSRETIERIRQILIASGRDPNDYRLEDLLED